jgi:hypothetical protein
MVWEVHFFAKDGTAVLEVELSRVLRAHEPLESSPENGRVVDNIIVWLRKEFKRQGFSRALYESEEILYRRWGVKEIHLQAVDDGRFVWIKHFGFQPVPNIARLLPAQYEAWSTEKGRAAVAIGSVVDYPDEFLASLGRLDLVKVLQ